MKRKVLGIALVLCIISIQLYSHTHDIPKQLVIFAETVLAELGKDPAIIEEVKKQNRENVTLNEIKALDSEWRKTEGVNRFILGKMSNDCALALYNIENVYRFIVETFAMDNQGANVGQTGKTSDYWQGDESKFTESFKNGRGAIHYGDVEYDDSVDEIVVQISVPVMEGRTAIGAITFGISLDRWERR